MFEWIERCQAVPLHCETIEKLNYRHPKQEKLMRYRNCKSTRCLKKFEELKD